MFLTEYDGCVTNGRMYYSEHGDEMKKLNTCDGMAFALLHEKRILTGKGEKEIVSCVSQSRTKVKN